MGFLSLFSNIDFITMKYSVKNVLYSKRQSFSFRSMPLISKGPFALDNNDKTFLSSLVTMHLISADNVKICVAVAKCPNGFKKLVNIKYENFGFSSAI